jgi:phosphatidylglycerophosphate synthase
MNMTHYMELLATNQPWNLLIFMAIPVILAETIAVTELYILYTRNLKGTIRTINKIAGIIAGFYFLVVFLHLFSKAFIPITVAGEWRTVIDVIAVSFYLLGVVPLLGITLLEIGAIWRKKSEEWKLGAHAIFVAIFLVVAHIAMIFGMLSPALLSGGSPMHQM